MTIRAPDVVVTRSVVVESHPARLPACELELAIEVLSDGTRRVDRVMKFSEYAEAGIPRYWMIDLRAPATLVAYVLVDGHYELSGEYTGMATLEVAGHIVALDLDTLPTR